MNRPLVNQIGDGWQFTWTAEGIEASVDRLREDRGGLTAEILINSNVAGKEGLLHMGKLNLLSASTRGGIARQLQARLKGPDWPGMLEQLCFMAVQQYREGRPLVDLSQEPLPERPRWLYWPYVEDSLTGDDAPGPSVFYGDGDSGKSLLALRIALGIALGAPRGPLQGSAPSRKVLYLDWETSRATHTERLHALCAGLRIDRLAMPPLFYLRMDASLTQSADAVRRRILQNEIGFVVVDSAGFAGGGAPEEAATALELYGAVRKLAVPALIVHHKRKSTGYKGNGKDELYGSVYWHNGARNVWEVLGQKDEQEQELVCGLVHRKSNNGWLEKRHAYRLQFSNDELGRTERIDIEKLDYADVPQFAADMPLRSRILHELQSGALTSAELAETLDDKQNSVQVRLSQLRKRGKVINLPDHKWGLPARIAA
jgi:hypothetical protein